ncbi:MAG TPA: hypothetical protein VF707_04250 [Ardenticatenaceae bacterium]
MVNFSRLKRLTARDEEAGLGAVVVNGEDDLRFLVRAGEEDFHLDVALFEVYDAEDGGEAALRQGAEPHVNALPVAGVRAFEVAVVEGIDEVGVAGMRRASRSVYDEGGGRQQRVEGLLEGGSDWIH